MQVSKDDYVYSSGRSPCVSAAFFPLGYQSGKVKRKGNAERAAGGMSAALSH